MSELIKREDAIKATWHDPSYIDPYNVLTEVRREDANRDGLSHFE